MTDSESEEEKEEKGLAIHASEEENSVEDFGAALDERLEKMEEKILADMRSNYGIKDVDVVKFWDVNSDVRFFNTSLEKVVADGKIDLVDEDAMEKVCWKIGLIKKSKNNIQFIKGIFMKEITWIDSKISRLGKDNWMAKKLEAKKKNYAETKTILRKKSEYFYDELSRLFGIKACLAEGKKPGYTPEAKLRQNLSRKKKFVAKREEEKIRARLIYRQNLREKFLKDLSKKG